MDEYQRVTLLLVKIIDAVKPFVTQPWKAPNAAALDSETWKQWWVGGRAAAGWSSADALRSPANQPRRAIITLCVGLCRSFPPTQHRVERQTPDKGGRDLLTWTFPLAELGGVNPAAVSMLETVRWPGRQPCCCCRPLPHCRLLPPAAAAAGMRSRACCRSPDPCNAPPGLPSRLAFWPR